MLTWEFPPRIVGGIARHCEGLAKALSHQGHEVHVVTLDLPGIPYYEETDGVKIYRTAAELGHPNFITWTLLFNHFLEKRMADLSQEIEYDVLHVHDWLTAPAGISFKHFLKRPMVLTVHSTEYGRSSLHGPDSYAIDGIEWWSTYEADKIIVTTDFMRREVCDHFRSPWEKVEIIPNGINLKKFPESFDRGAVRHRYGVRDHEKLVLCVGRLVPQKGVEDLIKAVPRVVQSHHDAKFVIVGDGWLKSHLEHIARASGQEWKISFTGFIPDSELVALLMSADVLVVPSVYEPFGIVALEGMAAKVPVVATQVGGLGEIIKHERTGILVYPRNHESLAWGVNRVLSDSGLSKWLIENALKEVQKTYSWESIAMKTVEVYKEVVG